MTYGGWLGSKPQGFSCACRPSAGITTLGFYCRCWRQTKHWSLRLHEEHFCLLNHLPIPHPSLLASPFSELLPACRVVVQIMHMRECGRLPNVTETATVTSTVSSSIHGHTFRASLSGCAPQKSWAAAKMNSVIVYLFITFFITCSFISCSGSAGDWT